MTTPCWALGKSSAEAMTDVLDGRDGSNRFAHPADLPRQTLQPLALLRAKRPDVTPIGDA
jgi:hypothetical protein